VCQFLLKGSCLKGEACAFSHNLKLVPCKFMVCTGRCQNGASCRFSHEAPSTDVAAKLRKEWIENQARESPKVETRGR